MTCGWSREVKSERAEVVSSSTTLVLLVPDLTEAIEFFTRRLAFRLDMIVPADAPHSAVVSTPEITLRLETSQSLSRTSDSHVEVRAGEGEVIISRLEAETQWHEGRVGMRYRDLIPGRLGGHLIASHIRIDDGGEVPDYVHYHNVSFQMIFCRSGWARVVYEDQGPPFLLQAGDCILQPPGIRHRVLVTSPGFEVIEVSSPAAHETWGDHELELPTVPVLPFRMFNDQHFVRHQSSEATWTISRDDRFEVSETGIGLATKGRGGVRVLRSNRLVESRLTVRGSRLLFLFILEGEVKIDIRERGSHRLRAGESVVLPAGAACALSAGFGVEILEVSLLAKVD